jgi:DNA-binding CsgD family transcriptional regulator
MVLKGFLNSRTPQSGGNEPSNLSPREREIVHLLAEGKTTKEVAAVLGISTKTAETHRTNIMRQMGYRSVVELVRYAIRNGMIEP